MTSDQPTDTTIPIPDNFPFSWPEPGDAEQLWQLDPAHFPDQVTPLDFAISASIMDVGFTDAARSYEIPIVIADRLINSYFYVAYIPQLSSPAEMAAQAERSEKLLQEAMDNLSHLWTNEWFPEAKRHLEFWEAFNLTAAPMPALVEHFVATEERLLSLWKTHFRLIFPLMLSISFFDETYKDLFPQASAAEAYELLAGFDNHTVESGLALWELSRQVITWPTVHRTLTENPASEVMPLLAEATEGPAFIAELDQFLQKYGKRSDSLDLTVPTWLEDPTPVIKNLQDYLSRTDKNLVEDIQAIAANRERRVTQARQRLQYYPKPIVAHFEDLLAKAQTAYIIRDNHSYWMDSQSCYHARRISLEFGRRLTEMGLLNNPEEVFYLLPAELKEIATTGTMSAEQRQAMQSRLATEEAYRTIEPPELLGTLPTEAPPDDPIVTMIFKLEGGPPKPATSPHELTGQGASPGTVRGVARVIQHPNQMDKLKPGDILVAKTTTSSWSPLFASVSGVVTDTGGVLSHCAVIAREYGVPAVVGTTVGTTKIEDGQTIEVDGDNGLVRLITT